MVDERGWPDGTVILINRAGAEDSVLELTENCALPVLQDTYDADVFEDWGASKWYLYFLKPAGELDRLYYHLAVDGSERERFIEEVEAFLP